MTFIKRKTCTNYFEGSYQIYDLLRAWFSQIYHTRMRLNCSPLNDFLFRCNFINSPQCSCGALVENTSHFLLDCPLYTQLRSQYFEPLHLGNKLSTAILLQGDPLKSAHWNHTVFSAVQMYITKTKRFKIV